MLAPTSMCHPCLALPKGLLHAATKAGRKPSFDNCHQPLITAAHAQPNQTSQQVARMQQSRVALPAQRHACPQLRARAPWRQVCAPCQRSARQARAPPRKPAHACVPCASQRCAAPCTLQSSCAPARLCLYALARAAPHHASPRPMPRTAMRCTQHGIKPCTTKCIGTLGSAHAVPCCAPTQPHAWHAGQRPCRALLRPNAAPRHVNLRLNAAPRRVMLCPNTARSVSCCAPTQPTAHRCLGMLGNAHAMPTCAPTQSTVACLVANPSKPCATMLQHSNTPQQPFALLHPRLHPSQAQPHLASAWCKTKSCLGRSRHLRV